MKLIKEIKSREGKVHFRRYRIIETKWFSVYVHHILKSDEDKHMHNHPWSFISCILKGGYTEEFIKNEKYCAYRRIIGDIIYHNKNDFHKVYLYKPTWTLVFCGPRRESRGYSTELGYMDHKSYRRWKNNAN